MTPEPIPEEDEEEIDPVEAVERAVSAVDRTEFDDGHELKQLIKNENGVTLPDAGKFLLKALRADDPPLRREGDTFVQSRGIDTVSEDEAADEDGERENETGTADGSADDGIGEGDETDEEGRFAAVPDELRGRDVWAVRYADGTVADGLTLGEAIDETSAGNADAKVGYGDVVTVDVSVEDGDGLSDRLPDPPFEDVYVEDLPERDGRRVPVVGYGEPDWWSDTRHDGVVVEVASKGFRETGEAVDSGEVSVVSGGRALDEWLADVRRAAGGTVFDAPPDDLPELDDATLTDGQVEEALGHVDPDLPYPDWRRIGAALLDNYADTEGGVEKARRVFESWSREGASYGDDDARFVRDIDEARADVDVGYLVHKACLEGWVWEAGEESDEPEDVDADEKSMNTSAGTERTAETRSAETEPVRGDDRSATADGELRVVVERASADDTDDRRGELVENDGGYGYETEDGFDRVTNFTLETRRRVDCDGTRLFRLTVRPRDEEPYEVTVGTDAFNSVDRFQDRVVTGFSTWFDGDEKTLGDVRERVGVEGPRAEGTETVGLYADTDEFVTPAGTLTEDGWAEDPETVFAEPLTEEGVADRWAATEETDDGTVATVLEHLPGVHVSGEFLTVLGWFYAAPLKPFVLNRADYFPSLWLTGDVEAAKPKLRVLGRAFGTDGEAFRISSGVFDVLRGSRSVPVWYDGYGVGRGGADATYADFDDLCLKTTRSVTARQDDRRAELTAPVVVTGDEPRDGSLRRRSIDVEFVGTGSNGDVTESHAELVGRSYYDDGELRHPDGADLGAHAVAYYSWIAGTGRGEFENVWEDCLRSAADVLESRDADDLSELHDVRVTLFGLRLYQRFAEENGVEPAINGRNRGRSVVSEGEGGNG